MASLKDLTIFVFEASWSNDFTEKDGYLPQASLLPYIKAFAENFGCTVVYRQFRTEDDLKTWIPRIKNLKAGRRILWISAHGKLLKQYNEVTLCTTSSDRRQRINYIRPGKMREWIKGAGKIDGVIVDLCDFGKNEAEKWLSDNVMWGLTYGISINWTESVFFGLKTIEWLYDKAKHPQSGKNAFNNFKNGILTGGYRKKEDRFSLKGFGETLHAMFSYKLKGSKYWKVTNVRDL
jgi:hypothetical protein